MAVSEHPIVIFGLQVLRRVGIKAFRHATESIEDDGAELVDLAAGEIKKKLKNHRARKESPSK